MHFYVFFLKRTTVYGSLPLFRSQVQKSMVKSSVGIFKSLALLRREKVFQQGNITLHKPSENIFAFSRHCDKLATAYLFVMNTGNNNERFSEINSLTTSNEGKVPSHILYNNSCLQCCCANIYSHTNG